MISWRVAGGEAALTIGSNGLFLFFFFSLEPSSMTGILAFVAVQLLGPLFYYYYFLFLLIPCPPEPGVSRLALLKGVGDGSESEPWLFVGLNRTGSAVSSRRQAKKKKKKKKKIPLLPACQPESVGAPSMQASHRVGRGCGSRRHRAEPLIRCRRLLRTRQCLQSHLGFPGEARFARAVWTTYPFAGLPFVVRGERITIKDIGGGGGCSKHYRWEGGLFSKIDTSRRCHTCLVIHVLSLNDVAGRRRSYHSSSLHGKGGRQGE
ncbi:hypothetical protein LY78DRAFT_39705 [Colletotrichum sublineola]|nr:hypothetical protein LY78DRAFT_39705 [Colletotrichum sublineola]